MGKHIEKRNMHTFYITENFKPYWNKFIELINKDKQLISIQDNRWKNQLISLALRQLIFRYVKEKEQNEASNQTNNQSA